MPYTTRETYDFISRQTNDLIVERKTCKVSGQPFPIFQSDLDFYEKISPTFNGKKYPIPTPTLCPEERARRRLSFRNERNLYRRTCDYSGQPIISIYSPDKPYKVYDQNIWRSDVRNAMDYGREYDFSQTFLENFRAVYLAVPRANLHNFENENSEYVNEVINVKSCYLVVSVSNCERSLYSEQIFDSSFLVDCFMVFTSQYCYQCYHLHDCYQCFFSHSLTNCKSCYHCINSSNLSFCVGCYNLHNKQYCINNVQHTKEEYEQYMKTYRIEDPVPENTNIIYRHMDNLQSERSYGSYITHSKHILFSEQVQRSEDCKYTDRGVDMTDCCDGICTGVGPNSLLYEAMTVGPGTQTLFCANCRPNVNFSFYCDNCSNCSSCFGCVGLRHKEYCIFNKQYEKAEYEALVAKIIEQIQKACERGEFFSPSLSPFGYNESMAQESFPLKKSDLPTQHGYKWSNYSTDPKLPENAELLHPATIPEEERKALVNDDSILKKVIICEESQRPFTIQKLELAFYRKMSLPLPKLHPDIRHEKRMKQRPGRTLYLRTCNKCGKEMVSVYSVEDTRKVYCEECYRQEVYG